jgi:glycosyltransferase-like protein
MGPLADVALMTYSTKPRGGVVHTLSLAQALHRQGFRVQIVALGDPEEGFFRRTDIPHTIIPAPPRRETLEERVFAAIDAIAAWLAGNVGRFRIVHTQDCISCRAAARVRDAGAPITVLRTVHHVDDFTTAALIDCQRRAIVEPDGLVVVSEHWRSILRSDYGVDATVIHNGVDPARFGPIDDARRVRLREAIGATDQFVLLSVGGVEPRKGSTHLFRALGRLRDRMDPAPVLVVVGGESFQDYTAYRDAAFAELAGLGLRLGADVHVLGPVSYDELHGWYRTADALAFPSVKEGWGMVVLEAMCADLPVVASDLPVFREYLTDGVTALLPAAGNDIALADALERVAADEALRAALRSAARDLVPRFAWDRAAQRHRRLWDRWA